MSSDPYEPDLKPAPPSRAYRAATSVASMPQEPVPEMPVVAETPVPESSFSGHDALIPHYPQPAAPALAPAPALVPVPAPVPVPVPVQEPVALAAAAVPDQPAAAPEPYSPFRVPPTRQLPEMVFSTPGTSAEARASKPRPVLKIMLALLAVVVVLVLVVIGFGALSQVSEGNVLQGELNRSAQVGQCYSDQIRFIDCSAGHTYEVFGTNQLAERDGYPGVYNRSFGSEACEFRFFNYVGFELSGSSFAIYSVYPSQKQWAEGERWEICVLSEASLSQLVGSSAGSGS